jgi:hypothetical protein
VKTKETTLFALHHYSVGLLTLLLLSGLNLPLSAQTVPTVDPGTPPTIDPGSRPEIIPDLNPPTDPIPVIITGDGTTNLNGTDLNNLVHPNGNIYDQVLMTGRSIPFRADTGQITRISFIDINDDIVQLEFSGSGTFLVTLDDDTFSEPARPVNYTQEVDYVKGLPTISITGADDTTNVGSFAVNSLSSPGTPILIDGVNYDATANIAFLEVSGTGMASIGYGNVVFTGTKGSVGINAPIPVSGRVIINDIDAQDNATPFLLLDESSSISDPLGSEKSIRVAGGDLSQSNGKAIIIAPDTSVDAGFSILFRRITSRRMAPLCHR